MAIDDNANYTLTGAQVKDVANEVNKKVEYVDIEATTPVPAVETAMIADGAVTSAKIADGTIATGDIADSAVTSAKIADGTIATGDIANGAVTFAKINPQSVWGGLSGGYTGNTSGLYVKIMRLDLSAIWKDAVVRFTFAASQSDSFAYDVMLRVARSDAIRSVALTAWSLQSTSHDLVSRLKLVAISYSQYELYWQSDTTSSAMANVYSFVTFDHASNVYGNLTMYKDVTVSALPAGTVYSCTVKNNLIS